MTATVDRYATSISLPRHMAEHVAKQAKERGMPQAAYVRLLIWQDMEAGKATAKA